MDYSPHMVLEGSRRYESTVARVAPSVSLRGEQVALKRYFRVEKQVALTACVAQSVSLGG